MYSAQQKYSNPVDNFGTVVGESPDCLLLSGTVVGENPDHVCWEVDASKGANIFALVEAENFFFDQCICIGETPIEIHWFKKKLLAPIGIKLFAPSGVSAYFW